MTLRWRIAQFFEIRWWHSYLKNTEQTTYLNWKKSYWRHFLSESGVRLTPGQHILDAGCGPAGIFMILENQSVDAIDPLLTQYETTLPHFDRSFYPQVRFIQKPLETFENPTLYDAIFCLNAINHVARLEPALDKLSGLLKPEGQLVLSTDLHRFQLLKWLFRIVPGDILHPQQHDLNDYLVLLKAAGLKPTGSKNLKKGLIFNYVLLLAAKSLPEESSRVLP